MNKHFTNRQICLMIYCIIVEYGVINLPKNAVEVANTGGWVSISITTLIFALIVYVIAKLQYSFENETIYEYSSKLIGKFLTLVLSLFFVIHYVILFSMISRMYCETINIVILYKTPVKYMLLLLYIVIYWVLMKGIDSIARLCEIYGMLSIISFLVLNTIIFSQGQLINIKPLFEPAHIPLYLKGTMKMAFPLLGCEILYFFPLSKNKNKNLSKYAIYTMLGIGLIYILVVESNLSVVGIDLIVHQKSTVFSVIRGIDVEFLQFLKRLDGLYIIAWSLTIFCSCSLWAYFATLLLTKIFTKLSYKKTSIGVMLISYMLAIFPNRINLIEQLLKYLSFSGLFITFIIPVLLLTVKKLKKI